ALQEAGVEAGVVQTFADLLDDPQLAHREHFRPVRHPYLGEVVLERLGFRLASHEDRLRTAGPGIGADNVAVLGGILGIEVEEIRRLETAGVVR
ncbi:MAG: CoA transferase, partial [Myxococcales bacterium]